jgi:FKBP-type peptidyl-prolyl cis-trans isomerase 2
LKWLDMSSGDAYGKRIANRTMKVPMSAIPDGTVPGDQVMFDLSGERSTFLRQEGNEAILDLNHPLSGVPLKFEIELVSAHSVPPLVRHILLAGPGGAVPKDGDEVEVEYLAYVKGDEPGEGEDVLSNIPEPMAFVVGMGAVVRGLEDGVRMMKVGEVSRFEVPMEFGYFHHGAGDAVPPYTDLVFHVKLLKINYGSTEVASRGGAVSSRD